jgi:hypothetical protein
MKTVLAAMFCCALVHAQNPALISGQITYENGHPVRWKTVTVSNNQSGSRFTARTASDGSFEFAILPQGNYDIRVEHEGFQQSLRKGVVAEPHSLQLQLRHHNVIKLVLKETPPDENLFRAKRIFVVNQTPENLSHATQAFAQYKRYAVTERLEEADLVVFFRFDDAPEFYTSITQWKGCCIPLRKRVYVRMAVYDRQKRDLLYSSRRESYAAQWRWAYSRPSIELIREFHKKLEGFINP